MIVVVVFLGRHRLLQGMVVVGIVVIGEIVVVILVLSFVEQYDEPLVSTIRLESYRISEFQSDFVVGWTPLVKRASAM